MVVPPDRGLGRHLVKPPNIADSTTAPLSRFLFPMDNGTIDMSLFAVRYSLRWASRNFPDTSGKVRVFAANTLDIGGEVAIHNPWILDRDR